MAVIPKGGHMSHQTTTAVRNMKSPAALATGGPLEAKSNQASLETSFPGSPLFTAVYNADAVKGYLIKLITNTCASNTQDIADAGGYWGFPTAAPPDPTKKTEGNPSTADLSYDGAPNIPHIVTAKTATKKLPIPTQDKAGPYTPNLHVPPIDAPTSPVETQVLPEPGDAPFVGNGVASPLNASKMNRSKALFRAIFG